MFKYCLDINFRSNAETNENFEIKSEYIKNFKDNITFSKNLIRIEFERSAKNELESIIYNPNHTIHAQINIAIIYRWLIQQSIIDIEKIKISDEYNFLEIDQINDVYLNSKVSYKLISLSDLSNILLKNQKNNKLSIALNHYMKALSITSLGSRFEHFWKSFNSLYSIVSTSTNEIEKLIDVKLFVWGNIMKFIETLKLISPLTKEELRKLKIREMILNDYPDDSKTRAYRDFCLRNDDARLCGVLKDSLAYREQYLKNHRMYTQVNSHLTDSINNNYIKDEQVLTFLVIKYSYFLRNKYFHAEKLNDDFNLVKYIEIIGLPQINKVFEVFLYELIKLML